MSYLFCPNIGHQTNFIMEANTLNSVQTAPKGSVLSWPMLFAILVYQGKKHDWSVRDPTLYFL